MNKSKSIMTQSFIRRSRFIALTADLSALRARSAIQIKKHHDTVSYARIHENCSQRLKVTQMSWFPLLFFRLSQPERDMSRLHRLLHDLNQLFTQPVQIHLIAQYRAKISQRLRRIILPAIETAINNPLAAPALGLKTRCNCKPGTNHDQL